MAILKRKQCRWPGAKGFPESCLCIIHQNFELLLQAVGSNEKIGDTLLKLLCQPLPSENCYLGNCSHCPHEEAIVELCKKHTTVEEVHVSGLDTPGSSSLSNLENDEEAAISEEHSDAPDKEREEDISSVSTHNSEEDVGVNAMDDDDLI